MQRLKMEYLWAVVEPGYLGDPRVGGSIPVPVQRMESRARISPVSTITTG